jgi:hypothetical protein
VGFPVAAELPLVINVRRQTGTALDRDSGPDHRHITIEGVALNC